MSTERRKACSERALPPLYFDKGGKDVDPRVMKVFRMKQYSQRTPGWYQARHERITASAAASTIMQSEDSCRSYIDYYNLHDKFKIDPKKTCAKKETQLDFILSKCGLGPKFEGNEYTRWGQKYENIVSNVYSQLRQMDVLEFGLIPHPTIDFLAASPDGIATDGTMLEIKCPPCRKVADYPLLHYWQQMQLQLACTDLEHCDFFDAHFVEYISPEDWEADAHAWFADNPDALHHIYGIMLTYELDVGEKDVEWDDNPDPDSDSDDANKQKPISADVDQNLQEDPEANPNENCQEDAEDVEEDAEEEDLEEEPTDEKRIKHIYPPPNMTRIDDFKRWAEDRISAFAERGKPVVRTYYKLHEYYISRATADPEWFQKNLAEMSEVWKEVQIGRTSEGKAILEQILQDRENAKAEKRAKRRKTGGTPAVEEFEQKMSIFVDLDVSNALPDNPIKSKRSNYIHELCLL